MKKLLTFLAPLLLIGCAILHPPSKEAEKEPEKPGNSGVVLILAPQGVDASKDKVGYNDQVKRVTQAFSQELQPILHDAGRQPMNVLDQAPAMTATEKLAFHSNMIGSSTAIMVTVETENLKGDERMSLLVQYIELQFTDENGVRGILPTLTIKRTYFLRGSKSGESTKKMSDLAADFVNEIQATGHLK